MNPCFASPLPTALRRALIPSPAAIPRARGRHAVRARRRVLALRSCASTPQSAATVTNATSDAASTTEASAFDPIYRCPTCYTELPDDVPATCRICTSAFPRPSGRYIDLTRPSTTPNSLIPFLSQPSSQRLFQLPTVSYAYERGWRDSFASSGFPPIESEYDYILDHIPPKETPVILDMSCATGLMSRRLARGGLYSRVIAADFSPAMLQEAHRRRQADPTNPEFELIRADVRHIPIRDASLSGVYAGAAIHCWPNPQDGLAELHRVLRPGGKILVTTFLVGAFLSNAREPVFANELSRRAYVAFETVQRQVFNMPFRFFNVDELRYLFRAAGFVGVDVTTSGGFVMVRAEKAREEVDGLL